jgi:hypothetical protein
VTANDGTLHVSAVPDGAAAWAWSTSSVHARSVAWTASGLLLVACADGIVWIYSVVDQRWRCLIMGGTNLIYAAVDHRGTGAAVLDTAGHILWIDLVAAQHDLASDPTPITGRTATP